MFTLMVPGLESAGTACMAGTAALPRLAALERLLARGRACALGVSPWGFIAEQAGGSLARWPVGPLSALGELRDPPRACLRVEPLGAELEQQGLFRLPAAGLGIGMDEAQALAQSFDETFASDGLRLQVAVPERWYLCWDEVDGNERDWRGCAGPARAIARGARPAPPEPALRRLMSEVEMLFHAHPVNALRRERAAPVIAGLHPWGGGRLPDVLPGPAADAGTQGDPYLAGLRRIGVLAGAAPLHADDAALPADGVAWPLAIECLDVARLAAEAEAWAAPLARLLRRGRLAGIRIVTGRAIHETRRLDALRFWRRPRPLGESC